MHRSLVPAIALVGWLLGCAAPLDPGGGEDAGASDAAARLDARALRDASAPDDAAETVADAAPALGPPYPIVLAHGFFGFEDFAGAGFVDYFWRVREALDADGETLVFTPAVDPFNDSVTRGRQLAAHVERILRETGHARVNLIGHSQGGLDARVVAGERPELVASVVTIATPHGGTPVADVVLGLVADERARDLADALARAIASPLYDADGEETSVFAALRQFSTPGVEAFDRDYPVDDALPFFSIAGRSDRHAGGADCMVSDAPDFVARWDGDRDPIDPLLSLGEAVLDGGFGDPFPNDGLVRTTGARAGRFLGCIPADHFDEIGQLLGDGGGFGNRFDHAAFYVELVRWVRAQGL